MDENPRSFTPDDMSLLRSLAQRAQVILWQTR
jgi:hypothetical protein